MKTKILTPLLISSALVVACGGTEDPNTNQGTRPLQCTTAEYIAFDAVNHANQDLRIQAYIDMLALMTAAEAAEPFDPALASTNFAEAGRLYAETASFQEKVQGRTDDHFADKPNVGASLDAAILAGLSEGQAATTALEATMARQKVDKTLVHFFYLSVYHELVDGSRAHWDEAYGYFGAPSDNAEGGRRGLASIATKRDATNNTHLADSIFNSLVDGSCALAEALQEANADQIDPNSVPALKAAIEEIDVGMQHMLAFSAGHEAFEMVGLQANLAQNPTPELEAEMWIKLAELDPYFAPLERLMLAGDEDSQSRATQIRSAIDAAWGSATSDWMQTFDASAVIEDIEAEYGIDIKG